jgi:chemotaxis protein MotB
MARSKRHEEHENHERWLVSYADFITLLFAFFVVMYATSQADLEKQRDFEESIKRELSGAKGGSGIGTGEGEGDSDGSGSGIAEAFSRQNVIGSAIESFPKRGASNGEIQNYIVRTVENKLEETERQAIGEIKYDPLGVRIELAASRLFASGSANLEPESARALNEIGKILKESGRRIIVEGHTDNEPIRTERFPSNWELSAARATKIVRYLIARHKISGSQLTAVAYADQRPAVPNSGPENQARNRRIEIMIVSDRP